MRIIFLALVSVVLVAGGPSVRDVPSRKLRLHIAKKNPDMVKVPLLRQAKAASSKNVGTVKAVSGNDLLEDVIIGEVIKQAASSASLLRITRSIGSGGRQHQIVFSQRQAPPPLTDRLIDNATLIRPDIKDGFSCENRIYGYYADRLNECQIFHVCVPMHKIFPANFTNGPTYTFSFICPSYTIFSQDVRVCAWKTEALECEYAEELYIINEDFFKIPEKKEP